MSTDTPDSAVRRVRYVTLVGMFLNIFLVFAKGGVGLFAGSQALVADAVHSLSDLVTDFAVLFGVKYWSAPPDASHPYGHGKIETIVSAFIGVALAAVAFGLAWDAIGTLAHGSTKHPGLFAFGMALVSIVSKEILFRWTRTEARRLKSPAMEANAWHHRSDAISSIPVAIAIAVSYFFPQYGFIDPVGAILVSCFILYAAWEIIRPTLFELTEAGSQEEENRIRDVAMSVKGIRSVHAVRARGNGAAGFLADLHVMVDPDLTVREGHALAHEAKRRILAGGSGVTDVVIHVEPYDEEPPAPVPPPRT